MGVSNKVTAFLNFAALLCSIPIIVAGIWLASKPDNECIHLFRWPVVLLGVLILFVSLAGFVGAYWNKEGLLAIYLFCMAALIVIILIFIVFAFIVTRPDGSYSPIAGAGWYKEYRLDGFSVWLRERVMESGNWKKIRTCLAESDVCLKLTQDYFTVDQFFTAHLSPLPVGCCKPPAACGYTFVNPTMWLNPVNPTADQDCALWSNDQTQLCYGCASCKAGLLGNLRTEWRKANVILIVTVVILICVYVVACSAFKNAQTEDLFRRYKQGWV